MAAKLNYDELLSEQEFAKDVAKGLVSDKKYLLAKYFYDMKGSDLFNQITRHPDYYLTNCEIEILNNHKKELSQLLSDEPYNIIELGPGEGIKTKILLDQLLADNRDFTYFAIDISEKYLKQIAKQFHKNIPNLKIKTIHSDFFKGLKKLAKQNHHNLVLFLGSSIGNMDPVDTNHFLTELWATLHDGDFLLIGFDLRKDIPVMMKAYDDRDGLTRDFNLNLLERINRELHANFNTAFFHHYATYDVYSGAMKSYLISFKKQQVYIDALHQTFTFQEFEPIHVENSYKYLHSQIEEHANNAGFEIVKHFSDSKGYFLNSLWRVVK